MWLTLTAMAIPIGQLTVLKKELKDIFGHFHQESHDSPGLDKQINEWIVNHSKVYKCVYSVRGLERSELNRSHGCPGRLWDRFL